MTHKHKQHEADEKSESGESGLRGAAEVTIGAAEYDELKAKAAKADDSWDKLLRANAEFDNAKKRLEKRSQELVKFANEQFLIEILPVVDDLDRAMASLAQGHDIEMVKQGLGLVQGTFEKVLSKYGVETIDAVGQVFDPNLHEAVGEAATDEVEEGHVAEELQKGYLLNGRLARPSRVRIAKRKN